jgi:hypothetical protein
MRNARKVCSSAATSSWLQPLNSVAWRSTTQLIDNDADDDDDNDDDG